MQALILAAGNGTRLKPLTDVIPKALVPVANKPLLQHLMEKLQRAGFNTITVNVHHKAGQVKNFIRLINPEVIISDESDELLDTGGAIKKAWNLEPGTWNLKPDTPLLIHNVDILSNADLPAIYNSLGNADATLLVSDRETQRYLIFDPDMRLVGWINTKTGEVKSPFPDVHQAFDEDYIATEVPYSFIDFNQRPKLYSLYAFAGIHVISPHLIKEMDSWQDKFSIIDFYLSNCMQYNIRGYIQPNLRLLDVGKLDTLSAAEEFLTSI